jgi:hypothetical protein
MHVCAGGGLLVDRRRFLPTDPSDYQHPAAIRAVGCSNLRCPDCDCPVRQHPGLQVAEGRRVLARELYDLEDWAGHPDLEPSHAGRLYACRCTAWLTSGQRQVIDADPGPLDPVFPWRCAGHPEPTLPVELDGVTIDSGTDLVALIASVLEHGPGEAAPPVFSGYPGGRYLPRIYSRLLGLPLAVACADAVADQLGAFDTENFWFFRAFPTASSFERLLGAIESGLDPGRARYMGRVDPIDVVIARLRSAPPDDLLADRCLSFARSRLLTPPALPEHSLEFLARHDTAWLSDHVTELELAVPGRGVAALEALEFAGDGPRTVIAGLSLAGMDAPPVAALRAWLESTPALPEVRHVVATVLDGMDG